MTSIIVSADDPEVAGVIGQKAAKALGYRYLGRGLLSRVADRYGVPEGKLAQALDHTSPERFGGQSRRLLLSYVETATLEELGEDRVVCAELGAHLYVRDVPHVLILRVLEDQQSQVDRIAQRLQVTERKANKLLAKDRALRARWATDNFGFDESGADVYDLAIRLAQIDAAKIGDLLVLMAKYRKFTSTTYSRQQLADRVLACRARTALLGQYPDIRVQATGDTVAVRVLCAQRHQERVTAAIEATLGKVPGVGSVEVHPVRRRRDLGAPE